jgi:hypothetical protein
MTLEVLVKKNNEPVSEAEVTFLPGFSSSPLSLAENASTGYYYGSVLTPTGFIGSYPLLINAEHNGSVGRKYLNFSVSKELLIDVALEKSSYDVGEDLEISGTVTTLQGIPKKNLALTINLSSSDAVWGVSGETVTNSSGGFVFVYETTFADPPGEWVVAARAYDITGNQGLGIASFNVSLPSKFSYFDVEFNSPLRGETFDRGSEILVSVEVSRAGEAVTGANVTAITINNVRIPLSEKQEGIYEAVYELPLDAALGDFNLMVEVRKELAGALKGGGGFLTVGVLPLEVSVKVISPTRTTFARGDSVPFIIAATYPDGSSVSFANATVKDPSLGLILLHETEDGTYKGSYKVSFNDSGTWGALVTVTDPKGNSGTALITLFVEKDKFTIQPTQLFLLLVFAVIVLFIVYRLFGLRMIRKSLLNHWKSRERHLKGMLDATQKKYFERRIDEETYLSLMRKYEGELVGVQSRIKDLNERLGVKKDRRKKGKSKIRRKRKK